MLFNTNLTAAPYGGRKRYLRIVLTPTFTGRHEPCDPGVRRVHRLAWQWLAVASPFDCLKYLVFDLRFAHICRACAKWAATRAYLDLCKSKSSAKS